MSTIDQLFDGVELSDEFKGKMKDIFEATVKQKSQECGGEMTSASASPAVEEEDEELTTESTVDTGTYYIVAYIDTKIPVKIFNNAEDANKFAEERNKKNPMHKVNVKTDDELDAENLDLEEDEEMIVKEEEDEDLVEGDEELTTEADETLDTQALGNDLEIRKILSALKINPAAFARSLEATSKDVEGNPVAEASFKAIVEILMAVSENPNIATKIAQDLKSSANDKPAMEEDTDMSNEDEDNTVDILGMDDNLVESVNQYLTYVAESFIEDNKLAIDQGLKTEIAESFMSGLKNLFTEHNINVPEETSVVSELQAKVKTLEEAVKKTEAVQTKKLNEEIQKTLRFKKKLNAEISKNIFNTVSETLSLTQKEKFKKLVENVEFTDDQSYTEKLKQISESLYSDKSNKKVTLSEETFRDESNKETVSNNPIMEIYSKAITNHAKF